MIDLIQNIAILALAVIIILISRSLSLHREILKRHADYEKDFLLKIRSELEK